MNCDFTSSAAGNLMKHLKTPNLTLIFITLGSKQMKNWKVRDTWTGKIGSTLRILIPKNSNQKAKPILLMMPLLDDVDGVLGLLLG